MRGQRQVQRWWQIRHPRENRRREPEDLYCCLGSISLKIENGLNSELEGTNGRDAFV